MNLCDPQRCTCAAKRLSGEYSLSTLAVRSLWALEFCLSFMDVLRARRGTLFSALLEVINTDRSSALQESITQTGHYTLYSDEKHYAELQDQTSVT